MPRLDAETWDQVKAEYWAGATLQSLAKKYNISIGTIGERKMKEGWLRDQTQALAIAVAKAESRLPTETETEQRRESAIEAKADILVEAKQRHVKDWKKARTEADTASDMDAVRLAKMRAETIEIIQKGERRALGIDKLENPANPQASYENLVMLSLTVIGETKV